MRPNSPTGPQKRRSIHRSSKSPSHRPESQDENDDSSNSAVENLSDREENSCGTNAVKISKEKAATQSPKPVRQKKTFESAPMPTDNRRRGSLWMVVLVLVLGIACTAVAVTRKGNKELRKCSEFDKLKKSFPKQDPYIWKALRIGIEGVLNNEHAKPSIFLILQQNNKVSKKITADIVRVATKCFDPNLQAVTLSSADFSSEDALRDYGVMIERYRNALKEGGVLLIADLNKIPAKAAKALHFICDNENPIQHQVVIFLTLVPSTDIGNVVERAEDTLNTMWRAELDENILDPLIARVTDQVLQLVPE